LLLCLFRKNFKTQLLHLICLDHKDLNNLNFNKMNLTFKEKNIFNNHWKTIKVILKFWPYSSDPLPTVLVNRFLVSCSYNRNFIYLQFLETKKNLVMPCHLFVRLIWKMTKPQNVACHKKTKILKSPNFNYLILIV